MVRQFSLLTVGLVSLIACAGCGAQGPSTPTHTLSTTSIVTTTSTAPTTTSSTTAPTPPPAPTTSSTQAAARASQKLAFAMLARAGQQNLVFSPYSIQAALSMIDQGARGQTAQQITTLLGAKSAANLAQSNKLLSTQLSQQASGQGNAPIMLLANDVWLQSGQHLLTPFSTTLSNDFGVAPQQADFAHNPDTARQTINSWVGQHTHQLIPQLFPAGSITQQTALVLANAIYLKAKWKVPFSQQTSMMPFQTATGTHIKVPFMNNAGSNLAYTAASTYQAVELPYASSDLSLLAIMPNGNIATFTHSLNSDQLTNIIARLRQQNITLDFPKLTLNTQIDLSQELAALGMPIAFTRAADFSAIDEQPLEISHVEHAAVLKVNQTGTIAAAATGISAIDGVATLSPPIVEFNHPFILVLRDDQTGAILFAAQVVDPSAG